MEFDYIMKPEALYFLGIQLNADYIDYRYISEMNDIQKDYLGIRQQCIQDMEDAGYIDEDFSGNISVEEKLSNTLKPIFFGRLECKIEMGDETMNIHIHKGEMTYVEIRDNLYIKQIDTDDLIDMLRGHEFKISCTHVDKGYYEESFSAQDMEKESGKSNLNKITSGKCYS